MTDTLLKYSATQHPAELHGRSTGKVGQAAGITDQPLSVCPGPSKIGKLTQTVTITNVLEFQSYNIKIDSRIR